jgi:hypothetical protein
MIAWFKTKTKLIDENESLKKCLFQMQNAAKVLTAQVEHADLLADRVKTHIVLGCPESYNRLKKELANYDKLYRRRP